MKTNAVFLFLALALLAIIGLIVAGIVLLGS